MDCFDYDAAKLADQSTFDPVSWVVTTQFANTNDFLDRAERKLGSDDDVVLVDKSVGGTPRPTSTFEFLENAKASLTSALDNPDLDLAANSHASAKSRATNFSNSTGNLSSRSVTTANFALTHKQRALDLAQERKKTAELSHTTRTMEDQIRELEERLALSGLLSAEAPVHSLPTKIMVRNGITFSNQPMFDMSLDQSSLSDSESNPSDDSMTDIADVESESDDERHQRLPRNSSRPPPTSTRNELTHDKDYTPIQTRGRRGIPSHLHQALQMTPTPHSTMPSSSSHRNHVKSPNKGSRRSEMGGEETD
jgi:hypothetical protein